MRSSFLRLSTTFPVGHAEQYGFVTKADEVDGLGDEAWILLVSSNGRGATYHWRRANLVIEAHVDCHGTCPWDVELAHGPGRMRSMRRRETASSCRKVAGRSGEATRMTQIWGGVASVKAKIGHKFSQLIAALRTEKPRFRGFSSSGGRI